MSNSTNPREDSDKGHHGQRDVFFSDGVLTEIQDFDYDAIDRGNPLLSELEGAEPLTLAADGLHEILAWCHRDGVANIRAAFVRFIAVTLLIEPRWLDNETMKQIGERMGITRACISNACVEFEDAFKIQFRRTRSVAARRAMREARLKQRNATGAVIGYTAPRRKRRQSSFSALSEAGSTESQASVRTPHSEPMDATPRHGSAEPNL